MFDVVKSSTVLREMYSCKWSLSKTGLSGTSRLAPSSSRPLLEAGVLKRGVFRGSYSTSKETFSHRKVEWSDRAETGTTKQS